MSDDPSGLLRWEPSAEPIVLPPLEPVDAESAEPVGAVPAESIDAVPAEPGAEWWPEEVWAAPADAEWGPEWWEGDPAMPADL